MKAIYPTQDLVPLSEFRAHVSELLKQTQLTGRPIIITQHGRGAGVLISAEEYEILADHQAYLASIERGRQQLAEGKGIPHKQAVAHFRKTIADAKRRRKESA